LPKSESEVISKVLSKLYMRKKTEGFNLKETTQSNLKNELTQHKLGKKRPVENGHSRYFL
jgi:predicted CopG family antitoxin